MLVTGFIFAMGVATVALSIVASLKFNKYRKNAITSASSGLSRAISWQLAGEAVIGLGTLVFAYAAHIGVLDTWSDALQSSVRFIMFGATSATTWHLYTTLKRLDRGINLSSR